MDYYANDCPRLSNFSPFSRSQMMTSCAKFTKILQGRLKDYLFLLNRFHIEHIKRKYFKRKCSTVSQGTIDGRMIGENDHLTL